MTKPRLFIGSSNEGIDIARAIQDQLSRDVEVALWSDSLFDLGKATLESLLDLTKQFDFAVLVLTPDDLTTVRGLATPTPRDNVVFEFGLFMGRLGRERTFAVCDRALPVWNDLAGITLALYDLPRPNANLMAAIGPACNQIRKAIKRQGAKDAKKSVPEFWRPFLTEETNLIIGHFEIPQLEGSGLIGFGDAMALIEIQSFCDSIGLGHPRVCDANHIGSNELSQNLILVGGADVNRLNKRITKRIVCGLNAGVDAIEDARTSIKYSPRHEAHRLASDIGVIIEVANPFNHEKRLLMLFGCYGYGTWAAARFAKTSSFLDASGITSIRGVECVVQTEIIENTPYATAAVLLRNIGVEPFRENR